VIFIANHEVEN